MGERLRQTRKKAGKKAQNSPWIRDDGILFFVKSHGVPCCRLKATHVFMMTPMHRRIKSVKRMEISPIERNG